MEFLDAAESLGFNYIRSNVYNCNPSRLCFTVLMSELTFYRDLSHYRQFLMVKGESSFKCSASYLMNLGRIVLGRVKYVGRVVLGRVVCNSVQDVSLSPNNFCT